MNERIKSIQSKILAWWGKFSAKQKTLIVSVVVGILAALGILYYVLSQPNMVTLVTCADTEEAAEVKDLLEGESIDWKLEEDNLTILVNASDKSQAVLLLGASGIPAEDYDLTNVFDGSFSTTEEDKQKKYQLYLEKKIASELETSDLIESAQVSLSIPTDDGTLISQDEETSAAVVLSLTDAMDDDQAASYAKYVATAIGNTSTEKVTLLDTEGNLLFSGDSSDDETASANTQLSVQSKIESIVKDEVKDVMLGTKVYDDIEVGLNLVLDFDKISETDHEYYVADGSTQGYLDSETTYEQETTGGTSAGTPGTDSNDTTYVIDDSNSSSSTTAENTYDYLPNEKITETEYATGVIKPDESSVTVVATSYVIYNEDDMQAQGLLDGTTFAAFKGANSAKVKQTVDTEFLTMVSNATGLSTDKISIVAYNVPIFQESSSTGMDIMTYVIIGLIVMILGFLIFVVIKSTRGAKQTELEPELSVESLLKTTKQAQALQEDLEDIGFNDKSETRKMIEKFVDENPEAVAVLLRNWLNEEWE